MNIKDYHATPGISSSNLRLLAESCIHLDKKELFQAESPALDFGSLVHKLILEPDDFDQEFVIAPKFNLRTNAGKDEEAAFKAANEAKTIVTQDDFERARKMANNALGIAGGLLNGGQPEQSFFAEEDGLVMKCRPDYLREDLSLAIDIKTTSDSSEFGLKKSVANYRYDWNAYWYLKVLRLAGLNITRYLFLFVDSSSPHLVKLRELSGESMAKAEAEVENLLLHYRQYKLTGKAAIFKILPGFGEL